MNPRLDQLVLALLADRWRRQRHNVTVAAVLVPLAALLAAFYLTRPFGGGL